MLLKNTTQGTPLPPSGPAKLCSEIYSPSAAPQFSHSAKLCSEIYSPSAAPQFSHSRSNFSEQGFVLAEIAASTLHRVGNSVAMTRGDVVIRDREAVEKKTAAIRAAGARKLQVIADFDGTLIKYSIDGRRGQSSHDLLQHGNAEYDAKRQALYDYYHPLEFSPTIPIEEKT